MATCLLLTQMLIVSADAATITIASTTIAPSTTYPTSPSATATLRIYSSITFTASDGTVVMAGTPGSGAFFKSVTCTITGGVITIPSFDLLSTTDAVDNSNARYTAIFFDSKGVKRDTYLADFPLPISLGSPITWGQIRVYKAGTQPWHDTSVYTKTQTDAQIQAAIGSTNDAGGFPAGPKGRVYLSVPPVTNTNPIAVGDNDPRNTPAGAWYWAINYSSFDDAVLALGSTAPAMLIVSEQMACTNPTVTSNIQLVFVGNGRLIVGAGYTITIQKPPRAPENAWIFDISAAGSHALVTSPTALYPQWWGSIVNDDVDDLAALDDCVASARTGARSIHFLDGTYDISNTLVVSGITGFHFFGENKATTRIRINTTNKTGVLLNHGSYGVMERIGFTTTVSSTNTYALLDIDATSPATISNASNTNPVVITTYINDHGFVTGDSVSIYCPSCGNTAISGTWTITRLSNNTFSIPVAGNGVFTGPATASIGALKTQQMSLRDIMVHGARLAANGLRISRSGAASQGDTIEIANPLILSCLEAGLKIGSPGGPGQNALGIKIVDGNIQDCPQKGIWNTGGQIFDDGMSFQSYDFGVLSADGISLSQVTMGGSDYFQDAGGGQSAISTLTDIRSESDVLAVGGGVHIRHAAINGGSPDPWFPNSYYNPGQLIRGTIGIGNKGEKGRTFMVVDLGTMSTPYAHIGAATTNNVLSDLTASYTINAFATLPVVARYPNGFTEVRLVASNTATTITPTAPFLYLPAHKNVTNATNTNPIVITTDVDHGFETGNSIVIANVTGNTAANGTWTITKISDDTFSIPTAGNGAHAGGGTVVHSPCGYTAEQGTTVAPFNCIDYKIGGITGSTEPDWDTAPQGFFNPSADNPSVAWITTAGSNIVSSGYYSFSLILAGGVVRDPAVGDYMMIIGAGTNGGPFIAKVTGFSHPTGSTAQVTLDKNAITSLPTGGSGYVGPPITDGTIKWIDMDFNCVSGVGTVVDLYSNSGKVGSATSIENSVFVRPDFARQNEQSSTHILLRSMKNSGYRPGDYNIGPTTYLPDFVVPGDDVASANTIVPTGISFTITGVQDIKTINPIYIMPGTTLYMKTTSAVKFDNTGNITFNGGATSLTTTAGDIVIAYFNGSKFQMR